MQDMEASIVPFLDESEKLKSALILTAGNAASAALPMMRSLKSGFHAFVPLKSSGGEKGERSFMLFNIGASYGGGLVHAAGCGGYGRLRGQHPGQ